MKKLLLILISLFLLATPVNAMEFTAPEVPESGKAFLTDEPETFSEGLWMILKEAVILIQPSMADAAGTCLSIIAVMVLITMLKSIPGASEQIVEMVGTLSAAAILLQPSNTLIQLGVQTVSELSEYGKLLLPILTAALAAQGGATASAALYTGTVAFDALLSALISSVLVPMVYVFLCLAVASGAIGEKILEKLKGLVKWIMTWGLKIVLYVFSGYMGITGVVSGTADAAAVKATKLTISGMVPVVGSILSDASETILVGAGVMKSAVGVYGLLAILAVWIGPFIEIGVQYLLLKITSAVCEIFDSKGAVKVIQDFSAAMGMLLAMTGTVCLLLLISVVCFMKGVG